MTTATQVINAAVSQVGYREGRGNNNKYGVWFGWNYQPYCAMGLTWAAAQVGGLSAIGGKWASCILWAAWFRARGRWYTTPQRGDIAFFDWSGNRRPGREAHVGLVTKVVGGAPTTVEFNTSSGATGSQSDGQGVHLRARDARYIVGYGRPYYATEISATPVATSTKPYVEKLRIPLVVDGVWGPATTSRVQEVIKAKRTGRMDNATFLALSAWLRQPQSAKWTLPMKTALQHRVGVEADGIIGPITVKALQRYLNRM